MRPGSGAFQRIFTHYFGARSNDIYHNSKTDFRSCFLTFDGGCRLELMTRPDLSDSGDLLNRFGYAHIAFSAGSVEEVDRPDRAAAH